MTTFAVAAPTPITPSPRRSTPQVRGSAPTDQPRPETVRNEDRSTQAPNAFLARLDELGMAIIERPQVTSAIEQGNSAPAIASKYGIRQGSEAYRVLESRIEAHCRAT